MISIIKERLIRYLQGDENINEEQLIKLGAINPELEHILLLNSVTNGNYAHTGGTDWHDSAKYKFFPDDIEDVTVQPDTREELMTMVIHDFFKGSDHSISRKPNEKQSEYRFSYVFTPIIDEKTGDVRVHLDEIDLNSSLNSSVTAHEWLFPRKVITDYLDEHPLNVYDCHRRANLIDKAYHNAINPYRKNKVRMIEHDGRREEIINLYRDPDGSGFIFVKKDDSHALNLTCRDDFDLAAWCTCLQACLMSVGYDKYYDTTYDIYRHAKGVERFADLVIKDPEAFPAY